MGSTVGWKQGTIVFLSVVFFSLASLSVFAVTFEYDEGELVRLLPEAEDDGNSTIVFWFSSPLNDQGEWQTTFDDAGTYEVTITADDGELTTIERVELVINNVNQRPVVSVSDIFVGEGELVDVAGVIEDPDGDDLVITYSAPLDEQGQWQTTFGDEGIYITDVSVSDGEFDVTVNVTITVGEKNQIPIIKSTTPARVTVEVDEGDSVSFSVEASDSDGDILVFTWFIGDVIQEEDTHEFLHQFNFDSSGVHTVRVDVSDGDDAVHNEWEIFVTDVNRAPVVEAFDIVIDEGETFSLGLPVVDEDGDELLYTYSDLFDADGVWTPTFDDAGIYTVIITVDDGKIQVDSTLTVTVTDVDRAPIIEALEDILLLENEEVDLTLIAEDPDGDNINFTVDGFGEGAILDDNIVSWKTNYDTVTVPNNFFSRILKRLRLAKYVYGNDKDFDITVHACGASACATEMFTITITNENRAPFIDQAEIVVIREGEVVSLSPVATDEDGDYVSVKIGKPFNRDWKTNFDSAGEYNTTITAYDGQSFVEKNVRVIVQNVNRAPSFEKLDDYEVDEGGELSIPIALHDPDADNITLVVEELPRHAGLQEGIFTWKPDHDTVGRDEGEKEFLITFSATDNPLIVSLDDIVMLDANHTNGTDVTNKTDFDVTGVETEGGVDIFTVKTSILVKVKDVNRVPEIVASQQVTAFVGEPVLFEVNASDGDGDDLFYSWKFGFLNGVKNPTAVQRVFTRPGEKKISVIVSDGAEKVKHTWLVNVQQAQ